MGLSLIPGLLNDGAADPMLNGLNAFYFYTRENLFWWGFASIWADLLLLLLYYYVPRVRRTPGWLILFSSVCEIYVAAGFVALALIGDGAHQPAMDITVDGEPAINIELQLCQNYRHLLLSILGFDMAAHSWKLLMYVDLIVVYHNPFRPNTARPLYHLAVVALACAWVVIFSSTDVLCASNDDYGRINVFTLTWAFVYAPCMLFVLLGGSLYLAVKTLLSYDKSSNRISKLARERVMHHCFFYLLLYGALLGLLAIGSASYQLLATSPLPPSTAASPSTSTPLLTSWPRRRRLRPSDTRAGTTCTLCSTCTANTVETAMRTCCSTSIHRCDMYRRLTRVCMKNSQT